MKFDKYYVVELDNNDLKLLNGGTWLSFALGFAAESLSILGGSANSSWGSAEGSAMRQALRDFQ